MNLGGEDGINGFLEIILRILCYNKIYSILLILQILGE